MTALSADLARARMGVTPVVANGLAIPVAASTTIYQGSLVAVNTAGYAVPASATASMRVIGVAETKKDNSAGAAGDLSVVTRRGAFYFANSSTTAAVVDADVGRPCYVVDDNTVARHSIDTLRPIAGMVLGVDDNGVLVEVGLNAGDNGASDFVYLAGADLSTTGQYLFVKLDGSSAIVLAATAGESALGVLQNAPTSGAAAIVRRRGRSLVVAGGTIADGSLLATTVTTARAKAAVAGTVSGSNVVGSFVMGMALGDGTSGNNMLMDVHPSGVVATTAA